MDSPRVCLLEDDEIMGESMCHRFALEGLAHDWHRDAASALPLIEQGIYAVIISDIRLPDMSGEELFEQLSARHEVLPPTLFITGFGSIDQAVRLLKSGARDYITKPFDLEDLLEKLRTMIPGLSTRGGWVERTATLGVSRAMRHIEDVLRRMATYNSPVLITGESGVGKEYAARYLHEASDSADDIPFVAVNVAAMPETLLEAELFGHERGAFTGATRTHRGVFERASGGILFMDEVGEMPAYMQAKLLRVIQDGKITRLGSEQPIETNVRLVCATNRDLKKLVETGDFREDLYYRINVVHIDIPPVRDRQEDIVWFAHKFVQELSATHDQPLALSPSGERFLLDNSWLGNLRELRHAVERACIFAQSSTIGPHELGAEQARPSVKEEATDDLELKEYLDNRTAEHILEMLESHDWRIAETASALGISRKSLWEKMKKYGLSAP